jgi:hypothetical protein
MIMAEAGRLRVEDSVHSGFDREVKLVSGQ